jgi:pyruvate formate lyase activating enzyme
LEYTIDTARLCKVNELFTVYVTNGYATPAALDGIGPYLDAWRVDIKGFSDCFYRNLSKVPHWRDILEITVRAKIKWGMHVEVVTNVIPGLNDDDTQLQNIALWIYNELGELTPWHLTRFQPNYRLHDIPPTPLATLEHAADIGTGVGLKFVYLGNVPGHPSETTYCPKCGRIAVQRRGYQVESTALTNDGKCPNCRTTLGVVT